MNFIVSTSSLLKSLQITQGAINSNAVLPILADFLFVIKGNQLSVFASDIETTMSTSLDLQQSSKDGKVAIPAKMLVDMLKTLPEQPLTFKVDEKTFGVEISTEKGHFKLSGENPDDFPKIPEPENTSEVSIPSAVLVEAFAKTLFAVSNDELRLAMTGVFVQLSPEGVNFVSTDAHKLVKFSRTDVKSPRDEHFILPKKALNLLKSALPHSEEAVNMGYNKSNAFFSFGNNRLICRLVDATYPDYTGVIPVNNPNLLSVNRLDLQNALRRIVIFANKTTFQVIFSIQGNELKMSAQDIDFSNEGLERIPCNYSGESMEIGFNARFLIEMLGAVNSDEVEMELSTPSRAGILRPAEKKDNEDLLMLMMPVMITV